MLFKRQIYLPDLLAKKSHFLFGARGVGKSTLIAQQLPEARVYDLLDDEVYERLLRRPKLLEEEHNHRRDLIVIDEIQRLPKLLNEAHRLIAKHSMTFLLTGSSARKLRRGGSNLLGGRAWETRLHPLTRGEIAEFSLLRYLNYGGLPGVYLSGSPNDELKNYVRLYLREEVFAEGLTRNQEYFLAFLDIMSLQSGEELSFQGMANESGVPPRTIQNYVQILEDTLIGFQLRPFHSKKRKSVARSKFYLFDLGVTNVLAKRGEIYEGGELFGKAFEHFVIREVMSYLSYHGQDVSAQYWRVASGPEVDLIIGKDLAVEIKSSQLISERHLKGLKALREEGAVKNYAVVSRDLEKRVIDGVTVYPWHMFLDDLWGGKLIA